MDDLEKHASSYQQDQEILDARGINMTVEEVAGLPTVKYSEKVQSLHLNEEDLSFLKGLRRRIKNRLASQNSRRRSLEHLRRLTRELRAVRTRRDAALAERRALLRRHSAARDRCRALRAHLTQVLQERSDPSPIPELDALESHLPKEIKTASSPDLSESYRDDDEPCRNKNETYRDKETFECRIEKLVQKSVNHIYEKKKISAKTVFLEDSEQFYGDTKNVFIKDEKNIFDDRDPKGFVKDKNIFDDRDPKGFVKDKNIFDDRDPKGFVKDKNIFDDRDKGFMKDSGHVYIKEEYVEGCKVLREENGGVLDLCMKEKRRSHGRKQSAPRRIAYVADYNDVVLDLKIKKENQ